MSSHRLRMDSEGLAAGDKHQPHLCCPHSLGELCASGGCQKLCCLLPKPPMNSGSLPTPPPPAPGGEGTAPPQLHTFCSARNSWSHPCPVHSGPCRRHSQLWGFDSRAFASGFHPSKRHRRWIGDRRPGPQFRRGVLGGEAKRWALDQTPGVQIWAQQLIPGA